MLYDEDTRDHMLQEEKIFKVSSIVGFVADRAPQYPAIVKDFEGQELLRQACWFHARHYLVDAYLVDSRMEMLLILINALFYIERVFLQEDDQSPEHRLEFRKEWSEPIVDRIMEMLKKMRAAGDKYGQMVHRTVDYILDDEDAFRTFLSDVRIDIHNIAIEMFQTYRYGKTQLASDRKSLLCPEFGVYVRVVGKLQIEQSELWRVH